MPRREYPDAPMLGVGAVVLDGDRVLLVRRGQQPLQGEWSIPGGALELGETLEAGVCREVAEETGLAVRIVQLVEVLDRILFEESALDGADWGNAEADMEQATGAAPMKRVRYHYVLIDFLCVPEGGSLQSGSDAADARWVAHEELNSHSIYRLAPATIAVIEKAFRMAGILRPPGIESTRQDGPAAIPGDVPTQDICRTAIPEIPEGRRRR
jgi:8-oxo-dGTP diphosphatase